MSWYIFIAKDLLNTRKFLVNVEAVTSSGVILPANPSMMGMVGVKKTGLAGLRTAGAFILSELRTEEPGLVPLFFLPI